MGRDLRQSEELRRAPGLQAIEAGPDAEHIGNRVSWGCGAGQADRRDEGGDLLNAALIGVETFGLGDVSAGKQDGDAGAELAEDLKGSIVSEPVRSGNPGADQDVQLRAGYTSHDTAGVLVGMLVRGLGIEPADDGIAAVEAGKVEGRLVIDNNLGVRASVVDAKEPDVKTVIFGFHVVSGADDPSGLFDQERERGGVARQIKPGRRKHGDGIVVGRGVEVVELLLHEVGIGSHLWQRSWAIRAARLAGEALSERAFAEVGYEYVRVERRDADTLPPQLVPRQVHIQLEAERGWKKRVERPFRRSGGEGGVRRLGC